MMPEPFTPGPWVVLPERLVTSKLHAIHCAENGVDAGPVAFATAQNAALIGAAPIMHAALSDPEWAVVMATVEDFSNGEVSSLVALGVIGMHLLALDHKRTAVLARAEGR